MMLPKTDYNHKVLFNTSEESRECIDILIKRGFTPKFNSTINPSCVVVDFENICIHLIRPDNYQNMVGWKELTPEAIKKGITPAHITPFGLSKNEYTFRVLFGNITEVRICITALQDWGFSWHDKQKSEWIGFSEIIIDFKSMLMYPIKDNERSLIKHFEKFSVDKIKSDDIGLWINTFSRKFNKVVDHQSTEDKLKIIECYLNGEECQFIHSGEQWHNITGAFKMSQLTHPSIKLRVKPNKVSVDGHSFTKEQAINYINRNYNDGE